MLVEKKHFIQVSLEKSRPKPSSNGLVRLRLITVLATQHKFQVSLNKIVASIAVLEKANKPSAMDHINLSVTSISTITHVARQFATSNANCSIISWV